MKFNKSETNFRDLSLESYAITDTITDTISDSDIIVSIERESSTDEVSTSMLFNIPGWPEYHTSMSPT